jgi:hypothetical protein
MAERTPLPTKAQLRKLLERLLPPNEEMDEVSAAIILEREGVDRSTLADELKGTVERRVEELRAQGKDVPQALLDTLNTLESDDESEEEHPSIDPDTWIDSLLSGRMPGNLPEPDRAHLLQAFRSRNIEFLTEEDLRILEGLASELEGEDERGED